MTPAARDLRDALKAATASNEHLTRAIAAVDSEQAELAMVKAWQGNASSRTWRAAAEMVILIEPCKVHPALGKRAAGLLSLAPVETLGPGLMPALASQPWAKDVLKSWAEESGTRTSTKRAIESALGSDA
ncbi:hypothetical protein D3C75_884650 [compost metagenome]